MTKSVLATNLCLLSCALLGLFGGAVVTAEEPDSRGLFVAVGYGGRRMVSTDGVNWEHNTRWVEQGRDDKYNFRDLCYGDGLFVAVGGGTGKWDSGSSCNIASTPDGKTWNVQHPPGGWLGGVAYGNGIFLAVGGNSTFTKSSDGISWDPIKRNPGWSHYRNVEFGNGVFMAIGDSGRRSVTVDGVTWHHHDVGTRENPKYDRRYLCGLAFGNGLFVATTRDGSHLTTRDGKKWTVSPGNQPDGHRRVVWLNNRFLDIGNPKTFASTDGVNWVEVDRLKGPSNVMFNAGRYVGWRWGGATFFSKDGLTWNDTSIEARNAINAVVFGQVNQ